MNYFRTTLIFLEIICFSSRAELVRENTTSHEATTAVEHEMYVVEEESAEQLRDEVEKYSQMIESTKGDLAKGSIDMSAAKAEISQEWEKLDFYKKGNEVVRIKS